MADAISVSLNAPDAEPYKHWWRSRFGAAGYRAVCDFLRAASRYSPEVTASAGTLSGVDIATCRRVAAELGWSSASGSTTKSAAPFFPS